MAPLNAEQLQQAAELRDILLQLAPQNNLITPSLDNLGTSHGDLDGVPGSPRGTIRSRDEIEDNEELSLQTLDPDNPNLPYTVEQGRAFKRHKNLTGASDIDADIFLKTRNPMRHLFQIALVALQCRDLLQGIKADQERRYKLPDTLAKLCQDYAHVALLSPKARCYRNSNKGNPTIAKSIVAAMRSLGVSDMPPAYETGRCDVLLKVLGKALTDKRYLIKTAIMESLSGSKVDIATLTRTCIGTSPAQPTAALYQRIAFFAQRRCQASDQPAQPDDFEKENVKDKEKDDGFWKAVDDQLAVYYIDSFTSADRQRLWDTKYQADVRLYGPVDNTLPITLMADLEGWLSTVNTAMETCQS
ncbi:hypothetical protein MSAN_01578300 [Mycena sanguinolenta]|uniref:Uncharacterized protein n=1 Tax=Mycena sanguinolenta TaxID=230812 RepID=A0A8H7CX68_9AGAR|nr:hypothetical protein MSAN_01578300 [Mycena sanguinolenta]